MKKKFEQPNDKEEYWFSLRDLDEYDLVSIPDNLSIVLDDGLENTENFPVSVLNRRGDSLSIQVSKMLEINEFWRHKYTPKHFADSIVTGIKKLNAEGYNISEGEYSDEGSENGICVWWDITLPINTSTRQIEKSITKSVEIVYNKALEVLEGLSSVLILGKDTDEHLYKLQKIAMIIEKMGYNPIIIKEQNNILGETVIQKVLRYALQSKFIIIENTDPSGHLYEIPHVVKMSEKITILLQENGKGSTWVFEDMFFTLQTVKKFLYHSGQLEEELIKGVKWAEQIFTQLCNFQLNALPWIRIK